MLHVPWLRVLDTLPVSVRMLCSILRQVINDKCCIFVQLPVTMQNLSQDEISHISTFCHRSTIRSLQLVCKYLYKYTQLNYCPSFSFAIQQPPKQEQENLDWSALLLHFFQLDKPPKNGWFLYSQDETIIIPSDANQCISITWVVVNVDEYLLPNTYSAVYSYVPAAVKEDEEFDWIRKLDPTWNKWDSLNDFNYMRFINAYKMNQSVPLSALERRYMFSVSCLLDMMGWYSATTSQRKVIAKQFFGTLQTRKVYVKGATPYVPTVATEKQQWIKYSQGLLQLKQEDCDFDEKTK